MRGAPSEGIVPYMDCCVEHWTDNVEMVRCVHESRDIIHTYVKCVNNELHCMQSFSFIFYTILF